ncbi:hypothetical protein [Geoalkalibacter sp.]|uniref:hypothetical protein n=1 Tax=Geoalkalibacter sp. TaxID=3041440 RepID=UPI00272DD619|nr:hypothetical protein [Geoalkalibacter sp.]
MKEEQPLGLELSPDLEPVELIALRVRAFRLGEFGVIYDSYHADSFFRSQFPERDAYIRYAWAHLRRDFRIRNCRVLATRLVGPKEFHLIFHQVVEVADGVVETLEMARFYSTDEGWRYHSSQKMELADFSGKAEDIRFADFDRQQPKVFF